MAEDDETPVRSAEELIEDGSAQENYMNVSASYEVAVLPSSEEHAEVKAARALAKERFEEQFGFQPGMRSDISAQYDGRASHLGDDRVMRKRYKVTIVSQKHW